MIVAVRAVDVMAMTFHDVVEVTVVFRKISPGPLNTQPLARRVSRLKLNVPVSTVTVALFVKKM